MRHRRWLVGILLCVWGLWDVPHGDAATYYVSTTGSNSNNGTSAGTAWATIQHAANTAVAGDTVNILAGTYYQRVTFPNSGTSGNRITFQGVRGGGGSWDTIIDGTTAVGTTWNPAPEVGDGVYKTSLGYTPRMMTSNGLGIWMIGDRQMNGEDRGGGTGFAALNHAPDELVESGMNFGDFGSEIPALTPYWYGIGALFGTTGGTTYLRFRYEEHPSTMNVRAAPSGATLELNGQDYITLQDLKVQGGEWGIRAPAGSTGVIANQCYIAHGQHGFIDQGVNTTLSNSTITYDGIGITFPPGDWTDATPDRIAHRWQYHMNKFVVGDTDTNDVRVLVSGNSSGFVISGNTIRDSLQGIAFGGSTSGTDIFQNTIYQFSDNCFYFNHSSVTTTNIHHNLIYDCDHLMRFEAMESTTDVNVYANKLYQVRYATGFWPKHIFFSSRGSYPGGSDVQVYHNTFAGAGLALTGPDTFPFVHVRNNLIATEIGVDGQTGFGTFSNNLGTSPWPYNPMPNFVLPGGHAGLNTAPSLVGSGLPGMTAGYYVDGQPDYGAIQAGDVGEDITPPVVAITAPANAATVSGASVSITADASDDSGTVTGVQFRYGTTNIGAEDTSPPFAVTWNTTGLTNGSYALTAIARDPTGNNTTSSTITVTVDNGAGDTTPPTVAMIAPTPGAVIVGSFELQSAQSDNIGVVSVQFKVDGANVGGLQCCMGTELVWNSATVADGSHSITATACDAATNCATSTAVVVTTDNVGSGIPFLSEPTGLSITANSTVTFLSEPTGLSITANSTATFLGEPTGLGTSGNTTVTFLGEPTGLSVQSP